MVGPFIFFDQMGPAEFGVGQGIDVRPHPHTLIVTDFKFRMGRNTPRSCIRLDR
jgi:hypothetical protein